MSRVRRQVVLFIFDLYFYLTLHTCGLIGDNRSAQRLCDDSNAIAARALNEVT